jgi:precorrin-6B methylase 2
MSGWRRHSCLETGKPWLTEGAISFLEGSVKDTDTVLEIGAGASSIFFGRYAESVLSLEESQEWFCMVSEALTHHKLNNVEIVLLRARLSLFSKQSYSYFLKGLPDKSFDWILIDGGDRTIGIEYAIPKLKQEGFLIIDNYSRGEYQKTIAKFLFGWERIVFNGPTGFSGDGTAFYRRL